MKQIWEAFRRQGGWRSLILFALDLIIPTAIFYLGLSLGASLYMALLVSAGWSAATGLLGWVRGQQRAGARLMLVVALASFAISLVTGSDRFLLARESLITSIVGGWMLLSLRDERPFTYRFTRPMLEGRFGTSVAWESLWEVSPRFRHIWRVSTVMWGVATLLDAVLRVVLAYTMPIESVPAIQTSLMLATVVLMQVVTNLYYVRAGMWPLLHGAPDDWSVGSARRPQFDTPS